MNSRESGRRAYVERMGTVSINLEDYERAGADTEVLRMVIHKIEDLPPLPLIVHKILGLTQNEKSNTSELAQVISNDQALTAKVLRIANSPLYHISSVVTSISHAVALLGFRAIRNLAMGLSTMDTFNESEDSPLLPRQKFWEHSLGCALASKAVADRIRHRSPDEAFVGGLLHDIGGMVFNQFFPEPFNQALSEAQIQRRPLVDMERQEIGIPHTLVGKLLLQKWRLPPSLAEAVASHHDHSVKDVSDPSRVDISLVIMVANALTKLACIGFGGDSYIHPTDQALSKEIPLEDGDYTAIISSLGKSVQEIKGFFGIKDDPISSALFFQDREGDERPRLTFYENEHGGSFVPARLMLRRFFRIHSFPIGGDIKGSIERTEPHVVFVDLSSEFRTDRISQILKVYRSLTTSPILFLLSRKVSKETREKSAKIGMFFLPTPFCPQELVQCISEMNLPGQNGSPGMRANPAAL